MTRAISDKWSEGPHWLYHYDVSFGSTGLKKSFPKEIQYIDGEQAGPGGYGMKLIRQRTPGALSRMMQRKL